jgi:acyl-CoA reductase-like NAD-dependent aldehyde dehydrogenase
MLQGVAIVDGCIVDTNPAIGEVISRVPCTPSDKLDELVQTAVKAQVDWNKTATSDRIECLKRGFTAIAQDQDKLVQLIVQ